MLTWSSLSLLIFYSVVAVGHEQKIQTVLVARWSPTSLLSEAAEFISDVDPYLFWQFVENVFTNQDSYPTPASDDAEADLASVSAFNVVSPAKLRLMEWAMTSRAYSPRVIMFTQMAPSQGTDCQSFVVFSNKKVACDVEQLRKIVEAGQLQGDVSSELFTEADHKYPSFVWSQENPPVAVLYGQLTSPVTRKLHNYLITKVESIGYILRPYQEKTTEKMVLSGYGVELQFKSTEYVAQDDSSKTKDESQEVSGFVFNTLHEIYPTLSLQLDKFQNHLASARGKKSEFEALKAWQVQELGLQASHFTTIQENFMDALLDVSGNFPSRAASLSSIRVPGDFKQAVAYNQRILQSSFNIDEGDGAFFLQGNYLDPDALDLFTFQDTMKSELNLMELLRSVYHEKALTRAKIDNILSLGSKTNSEPDLALDLRDSSIYWINDLEKDEEYEDWPDDLTQLFFRMGGVMLRPVRRNVFNLLLTLDPDDVSTAGEMLKLAQSFMAHKAPVRIGVVFCPTRESNTYGLSNSDLIRRILNYAVAEEKIKKVFNDIVSAFTSNDFTKLKKAFGDPGEEFDFGAKMSCEFVKKSGRPTPGAFLNGVPLKWDTVDDFEEVVLSQLLREAQAIQIDAYNGRVRDDTDIFEYLMNKPNVQQRLNDKILDASNAKYISFGTEIWEPGKLPKNPMARLASSLKYLTPSGKRRTPVAVTMWIFSDVSSLEGQKFLLNAAEFLLDSSTHSRIAFIPTDNGDSAFKTMLLDAFAADDLKKVVEILKDYNNDLPGEGSLDEGVFDIAQTFMKLTGVPVGGKGVVVNGRLIGPLVNDELFDVGDWTLVEKFSFDSCAKHFDEEDSDADSIMRVCAALGDPVVKNRNAKRFQIPAFEKSFKVDSGKENDEFYVDLTVVVDPASRTAHKIASVLSAVRETIGQWLKIQIVFNPPAKHSELPLKSYYRYSAGERFNENIVFENIPRDPLFTQNFYAPDNWMVEAVKGVDDLDNIRLRDLGSTVDSVYELEHLLIEGHCLESKTGSPPRGLQFTISSATSDASSNRDDKSTIVMANLGYFQLKAEPGVWNLGLREGPSKEIFSLETHNLKPVVVQSFQSVVVKVKVKRNLGKETTSLLDSEQESGGWFNFGSKKTDNEDDVLNIFSVASGHLYERVLKIMMLSVLKNTKSKVKFWFLKNYLSPTVKDILPEMAKEYGFEYELVQYHWPRWLNPQREKQRIIWGYKILFLDVLFPLSLKKIVFVDADQVVRTDLKELFELDLEGNPYGYTPFCDSRTEMEGFRFWKKGYWKSHLGKRKYHISALYVVDLVRFRRIAAGDRLRGQYQALSQDPNSLSNLDQDLPNNMIHQVGIKSLPQEWLWCETWCDSDSKKYAKTIDLCNNPLTKEPKLDAAQRIVPEWKGYDQELREFTMRVRGSGDSTTKDHSEKHTEL